MHIPGKIFLVCFLSMLLFLQQLPVCAEEPELPLYARSAVLMDGDSGRILYGKEAETALPMASTTKIMTCILALEEAEPEQICTASPAAASQPQVKLGMRMGERFYLKDLLYSLMLESHNDTAVCVAESIDGSVGAFAGRMNQKAEEIGCCATHYVTPNGLDGEDALGAHRTTAKELALVLRYCIVQSPKAEEFLAVTGTAAYSFSNLEGTRSFHCTNHNAFLSMMEGALTGKTGFTDSAGYCYVGALRRDGKLLIVALLACGWPGHKTYKWADTRCLMEYGLQHYEKRSVTDPGIRTGPVRVERGKKKQAATIVEQEPVQQLLRKDEQVTVKLLMQTGLSAPVDCGQQVGALCYYLGEQELLRFPVRTAEAVEEIDFGFCLQDAAKRLLLCGQ